MTPLLETLFTIHGRITTCVYLFFYNSVNCGSAEKLHLVYTKEAKEVT